MTWLHSNGAFKTCRPTTQSMDFGIKARDKFAHDIHDQEQFLNDHENKNCVNLFDHNQVMDPSLK